MSIYIIRTPDIGEGIVEAELVAWHVKPGDEVHEDQPLADVMTDKASVEIPSPVTGRVLALGAELGAMVRVGSELVRLEVAGAGAQPPAPATATAAAPSAPASEVAAPKPLQASPAAAPAAAPAPATVRPAMPTMSSAAPPAAAPASLPPHRPDAPPDAAKPLASPAVRQRARHLGVDLHHVRGSGPGGRIVHADLDAARAAPARAAAPPAVTRSASGASPAEDRIEQIPVIGLRRRIAQQMQLAKRQIPHFTYVEEVDVTELEALRERLNKAAPPGAAKLTLLPFIMRAMVVALRDFPQINACFDDDKGVIERHSAVHLGVAAQTDAGLMVPVVRHAQALGLREAAAEVARLADAARRGAITRGELQGSTITLTSLGALGGIVSTPVINYPEVAIVGVNRIVEKLVMHRGLVASRLTMNLSSSFDHRVVDGMDAARFIQALRALLESPALLWVEV